MSSVSPPFGASPTPEILPAQHGPAQHGAAQYGHDPRIELVARDPLARGFALPCTLTLEIPVLRFTVGDLMRLAPGTIVETLTQQNEDLPLQVNGQLVGLVEIEVMGDNLAVRLTGIA